MNLSVLSSVGTEESESFYDVVSGRGTNGTGMGTSGTVWFEVPAAIFGAPVRFECPTNTSDTQRYVEYELGGGTTIQCGLYVDLAQFYIGGFENLPALEVGMEIGFSAYGENYFYIPTQLYPNSNPPGFDVLIVERR